MQYTLHQQGKFQYVEEGEGEALILLHGLFGNMSNFTDLITHFKQHYKVFLPILPIYELPIFKVSLPNLTNHIEDFVEFKQLDKVAVVGNSLGGHIALLYTLQNAHKVSALILTGSSGLYENAMSDSFPKRGNYEFIKEKTEYTFYDPKTASKELVDEVFNAVNNREKALRIVSVAKSAIRNNLADQLHNIKAPTLLVWGNQDRVTPPDVARDFNRLIPHSHLHFIDKCGHAPMMEQPDEFNHTLEQFLDQVFVKTDNAAL